MSLDLFEETGNVLANLRPVADPEPGAWDNFTAGAGKVAMQTFAKAGRAASMAVAPLAMALEKEPGSTEVQDKFFKAHDETFGRAVDYWTPKPGEVGEAGQVVGQLLGTLPMVFASPAAAVAQTQLSVAEDMARKGVDAGTAQAIGATQAAGLGLGIWVPILGKTLAQRVLVGGAGFNVVQGGATRAISAQLAEGTAAEGDFKTFDPTALTLDVLLGAAFGGIAHINPRMRAEGEAWHQRLTEWGAKLKPSEVDALATLRQAQHLNADSMPGKPVDVADTNAHVDRMRQAIDDLANDRPVDVENMPAPRFEADAVRTAEAEDMVRLWRGQFGEFVPDTADIADRGRWFSTDKEVAEFHGDNIVAVDVPKSVADAAKVEDALFSKTGRLLPAEYANKAQKVSPLETAAVDLPSIISTLEAKYPDMKLNVLDGNGPLIVSRIVFPKELRGQGFGTEVMHALTEYADATGRQMALTPSKDFGGTVTRLKKFYKKLGFVENKGKNKDFAISETMLRDPVATKSKEIGSSLVDEGAARPAAETGPAGDAQAAGLDPLAAEAIRFASENPDIPMFVGKNADGSDITTTPRQWLEDADAAMRQANDDVNLFEIAAGCLFGGGR